VRSLLDRAVDELTVDELRAALASAGDEDDRWEAKGDDVRPEHVVKAIAGLANRTGGLLLLGASRASDGSWVLAGTRFSAEPRQWVARVIRDSLTPSPECRMQMFEISPGHHAVVVRVDPHPNHLTVTNDGRVLRREHGSTEPVTDGAELTRLIQARSGSGPAAALDPDASPRDLGDAALAVIEAGQDARLRSFISRLQTQMIHASEFEPFEVLETEADRSSAITGALM
jgi:predicted HTH transcriptional regulator